MEIILNIISALLYCSVISSASSYYMYDDTPNGFVSKVSGVAYAKYGALHKKRYTGNSSNKFMKSPAENAVDSHFRVMKSPPMTFDQVQSWNARNRQVVRITEAYKNVQNRNRLQDERPRHEPNVKSNTQQENKENTAVREVVNVRKDSRFDPKHNSARLESKNKHNKEAKQTQNENHFTKGDNSKERYEMYKTELNINKKSSDPQKNVKMTNSRPTSVSHTPNHYRRVPVAEKTVRKAERYSDSNTPIMHNVLEDISNKMTKSKKYDNKKRETGVVAEYVVAKLGTPRPLTRENMVKYIAKEVVKDHFTRADAGRIGSSEVHIETNDTPYAVFYRMNPVAVYEQDEILMDTIDDKYDNSDANREKRINTADLLMLSNHKPKMSANVKLHKKMKNFSNFKRL